MFIETQESGQVQVFIFLVRNESVHNAVEQRLKQVRLPKSKGKLCFSRFVIRREFRVWNTFTIR